MMINKLISFFEKAYSPLFNILVTIIASRIFGVDAVGSLALVFIFSGFGQYIVSRGIDQDMQVAFASHPFGRLAEAAIKEFRKRLLILFFTIAFLLLAYPFLLSIIGDDHAINLSFIGIGIGASFACTSSNEIRLIVGQNFKKLLHLKYLSGFISISIGLFLVIYKEWGPNAVFGILILEKILYLLFTIVTLKLDADSERNLHKIEPLLPKVPKINIYALLNTIAVLAYNRFDQLYIYNAFSHGELGVYSTSAKFFELANLIILALISSSLHLIADRRLHPEMIISMERKLLAVSFFLVIFISVLAPLVLDIIFHIEIKGSLVYIYALALSTFFGSIGVIKGLWVAKNNRYHFHTSFTIIGGVFAILIFTIFRPNSLLNVALILASCQLLVNIVCPLFVRDERDYLISLLNKNRMRKL